VRQSLWERERFKCPILNLLYISLINYTHHWKKNYKKLTHFTIDRGPIVFGKDLWGAINFNFDIKWWSIVMGMFLAILENFSFGKEFCENFQNFRGRNLWKFGAPFMLKSSPKALPKTNSLQYLIGRMLEFFLVSSNGGIQFFRDRS
jgi:hypothetical protein